MSKRRNNDISNFQAMNFPAQYSVAYGTGYISPGYETYDAVSIAIKLGFRIFDTAYHYGNEYDVGKAIRDSGIRRDDFIVITKLSHGNKIPEIIHKEFNESFRNLGLNYIDIYLIHAPKPWEDYSSNYFEENIVTFDTISKIRRTGLIKEIGVSNFEIKDLQNLLDNCNEVPDYNQIPHFIGKIDSELINLCEKHKIKLLSNSPLAKGKLLENELITKIANKYAISSAQLSLKYVIQKGLLPIVRSTNIDHLLENINLEFLIKDEDMLLLSSIVTDPRIWD